jgi:hypothetical protein
MAKFPLIVVLVLLAIAVTPAVCARAGLEVEDQLLVDAEDLDQESGALIVDAVVVNNLTSINNRTVVRIGNGNTIPSFYNVRPLLPFSTPFAVSHHPVSRLRFLFCLDEPILQMPPQAWKNNLDACVTDGSNPSCAILVQTLKNMGSCLYLSAFVPDSTTVRLFSWNLGDMYVCMCV